MLSERQQQIIGASIGLIDQLGIQGFTIKNLSKEIGISEPAIYRHFASKVEILSTILDEFKQRVMRYHSNFDAENTGGQEKIESFFGMIFQVFTENPTLISVIFAEEIFRNEPALTQQVMEIQNSNEAYLEPLIQGLPLNEALSNTPVEMITMMFLGPVRLLTRKWKMNQYDFDLREQGNQLIGTILKSITL